MVQTDPIIEEPQSAEDPEAYPLVVDLPVDQILCESPGDSVFVLNLPPIID